MTDNPILTSGSSANATFALPFPNLAGGSDDLDRNTTPGRTPPNVLRFSGLNPHSGRRFSLPGSDKRSQTRRGYCLAPWARDASSSTPLNASNAQRRQTRLSNGTPNPTNYNLPPIPPPLSQSFTGANDAPNHLTGMEYKAVRPGPQPPHTPLSDLGPAFGEADASLLPLTEDAERLIEKHIREQRQTVNLFRRQGLSPRPEDSSAGVNPGSVATGSTPVGSKTPQANNERTPRPPRAGKNTEPEMDAPNWDHFAQQFRLFSPAAGGGGGGGGEGGGEAFPSRAGQIQSSHSPIPTGGRTRHLSLIPIPSDGDEGDIDIDFRTPFNPRPTHDQAGGDPQPWAIPFPTTGPTPQHQDRRGKMTREDYDSRAYYHYSAYLPPSQQQQQQQAGSTVDRGSFRVDSVDDASLPQTTSSIPQQPPPPPTMAGVSGSHHQLRQEVQEDVFQCSSKEGDDLNEFDGGVFGSTVPHVSTSTTTPTTTPRNRHDQEGRRQDEARRAQLQDDRAPPDSVVDGGQI